MSTVHAITDFLFYFDPCGRIESVARFANVSPTVLYVAVAVVVVRWFVKA